jgi:hypothetical protein
MKEKEMRKKLNRMANLSLINPNQLGEGVLKMNRISSLFGKGIKKLILM